MIKVSVDDAARLMNKGRQFVRIALQRQLVNFGFAVKMNGEDSKKYDYYINPHEFANYLGLTEEELVAELNRQRRRENEETMGPLFQ